MNSLSLITQFSAYQQKVLALCEKNPGDHYCQYHPDLSPLGWHVGHCVYTEIYWIREQLLGLPISDQTLKSHYIPELTKKSNRGKTLPGHQDLCQWSRVNQQENLTLMSQTQNSNSDKHSLMNHDFLLYFLIQHYAQHFEIMHMILVQRALRNAAAHSVQQPLTSSEINTSATVLDADNYVIGSQTNFLPYDNEYPPHEFAINAVNIADNPISNSEFLLFMEESGYRKPEFWSQTGWRWREKYDISCPAFWLQDSRNNWFAVDIDGTHDLNPEQAVWGINYFEAEAFANWVTAHAPVKNARLPHEYEWEAAKQKNCLRNTGQVWEWCENIFHPYRKFRAFPYDGYSAPYFDEAHFVMRGNSRYTPHVIQRDSFRNYYQADKRHQFVGCRLIFE